VSPDRLFVSGAEQSFSVSWTQQVKSRERCPAECDVRFEPVCAGVVEHERGWRAEFAYPKSFVLAPGVLPFSLSAIDARGLRVD